MKRAGRTHHRLSGEDILCCLAHPALSCGDHKSSIEPFHHVEDWDDAAAAELAGVLAAATLVVVAVLSDPVELLQLTCRIVVVVVVPPAVVPHPRLEEVGVGLPRETYSTAVGHRVVVTAAAAGTIAVVLPRPMVAVPLAETNPTIVRLVALGPALELYSTVVVPSCPVVVVVVPYILDLAPPSDNTVAVVVAIGAVLAEIGVAQSFQDSPAMETS